MSVLKFAKNLGVSHNVSFRVIDINSGKLVQEHIGHNAATNALLTGIAHYLTGEGVLNQGYQMLSAYVPQYISLGTMGLIDQSEDKNGLPAKLGVVDYDKTRYNQLNASQLELLNKPSSNYILSDEDQEILRCVDYMTQCPGYGADGYDSSLNNNRRYAGLGPIYGSMFLNTSDSKSVVATDCELISSSFPRSRISFRDIVPEYESELPKTIDIVFSAMISTGALAQFRAPRIDSNGNLMRDDAGNIIYNPYVFITEAGLWSKPNWSDSGDNGLLAAYRITPSDVDSCDMADAIIGSASRSALKQSIIKVGVNQVVQVIWKIQLGSIEQLTGMHQLYPVTDNRLRWELF